ncbi:hypothetical protein N7532_008148 [Penicillium argentinense]|uniref:S-adenosyl-L-methionine-dependent methyltransferase n=1 Tax=Penicillium argentinense TaxID=1131581 RepID=A0A9W9EWX6_9EURO|nr:uncharacterized protein N7532_008148 [Penicillium argentinense]KAJ5089464.1 hypothetical protein N7532_008148 [Penicillium argentinense]
MAAENENIAVDPDLHLSQTNIADDYQSETTSLSSSIYRGLIENGRRYQTMRENEYWSPADELQFESLEAGHAVAIVLDCDRPNPLFRSPVGGSPKNILDIGTGNGLWAIDCADMFPQTTVRGVDLFPPPVTWMPPNCILEVDDVLREWTWREPFDFIHLRIMLGSFTAEEWHSVYQKCYENLKPGGWIEQLELDAHLESDDNSIPAGSMAETWGDTTFGCANRSGRGIDTINTMRDSIERVGFINIHEKAYKWPIGVWPKDKQLKEAGLMNYHMWSAGLEGWGMWLLTKFGAPNPWPPEQVQAYVGKIRSELKNPNTHAYQRAKRVWARKPLDDELRRPKPEPL